MDEVPMASLSPSVHKPGLLEIHDQVTYLPGQRAPPFAKRRLRSAAGGAPYGVLQSWLLPGAARRLERDVGRTFYIPVLLPAAPAGPAVPGRLRARSNRSTRASSLRSSPSSGFSGTTAAKTTSSF